MKGITFVYIITSQSKTSEALTSTRSHARGFICRNFHRFWTHFIEKLQHVTRGASKEVFKKCLPVITKCWPLKQKQAISFSAIMDKDYSSDSYVEQ